MTQDEIIELAIQGHASTRDAIRWAMNQEREACAKLIEQSRAYQLVWYPKGYSINPNKINSFYEFQWNRSMDAIRARGQA
jgi:hypothetical protein